MPSGSGFLGGYGVGWRSAYATPPELAFKPWALDFSQGTGWPPFPTRQRFRPDGKVPQWRTEDWDPALRFWTLPFDPHLTEWLQDLDLSAASVMAAREFAGQPALWQLSDRALVSRHWIDADDLAWRASGVHHDGSLSNAAWNKIDRDLEELDVLMMSDRARYQGESDAQGDGIPAYLMHFLNMDAGSKPWTVQLIRSGLAIGNLVYMHYKSRFKRVRPSTLCPGLLPPFGPPRHPSFPSGHSFLGHFIALLLLEIPQVADRYGIYDKDGNQGRQPKWADFRAHRYGDDMRSPLLWLAWRLARNRERMGLHYPSDSAASRTLAAGVWQALFDPTPGVPPIMLPTLRKVLVQSRAEWV
jgi:hypothetical protein